MHEPGTSFQDARAVVVLDFETTGLCAGPDRTIEAGAVRLVGGRVDAVFSELMNPGFPVSSFITLFTGITNDMLAQAAPCEEVMHRLADFLGDLPLVAHNAGFDKKFLQAELARIGRPHKPEFACSMLVARRVYPDCPNHRLQTLVATRGIPHDGTFHRAAADALMTAHLWSFMLDDLKRQWDLDPISFSFMQRLMKVSKNRVQAFLEQARAEVFSR